MFLEDRAMGEPYRPEKYRLPRRFILAMSAAIGVVVLSIAAGLSYWVEGRIDAANGWFGVGKLFTAFEFALILVAIIRTHGDTIEGGPS
ncbi:MAG TPA: hypothetical protein VMH91_03885 [Candidatus Paceibacterota bacterium]|nr:hypothetical protein [Candidatus Paceibacterota bacterium]